jgi:thioredoxin 1
MITQITQNNYQDEVKNHAGRVLIDFYTPTCPPCRAMAPTLEQIATEQQEMLKVVKVDASEEQELAAEFGIRAVPTFVLLNAGAKKAQLTGLRSKKDFEKWLTEN